MTQCSYEQRSRANDQRLHIYNNESAKGLPVIVFWTRNGKTERAVHLGKRGTFKTFEEAKRAVHNATHYGTQNV